MNKFQKTVGLALAALLCAATVSMSGCGSSDGSGSLGVSEKVDKSRTQLYVANFNGGFGEEWLLSAKKKFEALHKDDELEPGTGKKGIQILIDNMKSVPDVSNMANSRNQVFFLEGIGYYEYVNRNAFLDITDMVTETLSDYGETRSIEDKFTGEQKSFLSVNGKYYAVPHYAGFYGITVDVDLFDKHRFFLGKDGKFEYKSTEKEYLAAGPDGEEGTYDDGFPATYDEFFQLCEVIKEKTFIPLCWPGQFQFYAKNLAVSLAADNNGREETVRNLSFSGNATNLIEKVNNDGSYTLKNQPTPITNQNGYELLKQEGWYNGLSFLEKVIKEGYVSDDSFINSESQTDQQTDFLLSSKANGVKPKAMIVEGSWWENEASGTFVDMSKRYNNVGRMDRRFRFIPLPKTEGKVGMGNTLFDFMNAYGFINANIKQEYKEIAIDFLQFCNTDQSLREFSRLTNTQKALEYTLEQSDLNEMSYYGKSLYELKQDKNTSVVYPVSGNAMYYENFTSLKLDMRPVWGSYEFPSTAFHNGDETAKTYFEGMSKSWQNKWTSDYGKYFN